MDENTGVINASIISFERGLEIFESVQAVRIHSKEYQLLIMTDHAPILGEIDGELIILTKNDEHKFENVKGFFTHVSNCFKLIER